MDTCKPRKAPPPELLLKDSKRRLLLREIPITATRDASIPRLLAIDAVSEAMPGPPPRVDTDTPPMTIVALKKVAEGENGAGGAETGTVNTNSRAFTGEVSVCVPLVLGSAPTSLATKEPRGIVTVACVAVPVVCNRTSKQ